MTLLVLGCERGEPSARAGSAASAPAAVTSATVRSATATPAAPAAGPARPLVVKVDGKVLPIRSQLAFSRGSEAIRVELSGAEVGCDDLRHGGRMLDDGEQPLTLELAPVKAKDGASAWQVVSVSFDRVTRRGKLAKVQMVASDVRGQVRARTELSFVVPANNISKQRKMRTVTVVGEIVAKGCGVITPSAAGE